MATGQSLAELKADNKAARIAAGTEEAEAPESTETEKVETVVVEDEPKPELEIVEEKPEVEAEPSDDEPEPEPEPEAQEEEGEVPLSELLGTEDDGETPIDQDKVSFAFRKEKAKRKKLEEESNQRIAALEAEVEANKTATLTLTPGVSERPKPEDFEDDYSGEMFRKADTEWILNAVAAKDKADRQAENQIAAEKIAQQEVDKALTEHNKRVDTFINKNGGEITSDGYIEAETSLKDAISATGLNGEAVFNHLVRIIGERSESVMFALSKNPKHREKLINLLTTDKTGSTALFFAGELKANHGQLINTNKTTSAPDPPPNIRGDETVSADKSAKKLKEYKKEYAELHKKGDTQAAYEIRKKAREAGLKW